MIQEAYLENDELFFVDWISFVFVLLALSDILDYSSYPAIVEWVSDTLGPDEGLNVLINNAAISSWRQGDLPVERDVIMYELETNTVAPLMLSQVNRSVFSSCILSHV